MRPRSFSSFDEYAAALGHTSLRLTVLGREARPWAMCSSPVDGIRIRWARDGGPCLFETAIEEKGFGFLTAETPGKVSADGVVLGERGVMAIPGFAEVRVAALDTVEWASVFIPASRLQVPGDEKPDFPQMAPGVLDSSSSGRDFFHDLLARVVKAAMAGAFESNPAGQKEAAAQLVKAARRLALPVSDRENNPPRPGRQLISRKEVVRRVYEALESALGGSFCLEEIARLAGVSVRSIYNIFTEETGVSPKRFLRLQLLNTARRKLLEADPENGRVGEIAAELGIWEWGRFSRDYRGLFGELPSQTLKGGRSPCRSGKSFTSA